MLNGGASLSSRVICARSHLLSSSFDGARCFLGSSAVCSMRSRRTGRGRGELITSFALASGNRGTCMTGRLSASLT